MNPISLPIIAIGAAIGGYFWGRGRTGDVFLTEDEAKKAYEELCESLPEKSPITARDLAELAAESIAPDMHWPPRFFATKAHKAAWAYLLSWAQAKHELAVAESKSICDVILPTDAPLRVTFKANPVIPTTPGGSGGANFQTGLMTGPYNIAPNPTPGRWSKQVPNLGLLGNTGQAYGLPSGAARLAASKAVNNHPNNRAFATYRPASGNFEQNHYAPAILSFDNVQPIYYPPAEEIGL